MVEWDELADHADELAASIEDWRQRAQFWERLVEYCQAQANGLKEDHEDVLGAAWLNEWEQ